MWCEDFATNFTNWREGERENSRNSRNLSLVFEGFVANGKHGGRF